MIARTVLAAIILLSAVLVPSEVRSSPPSIFVTDMADGSTSVGVVVLQALPVDVSAAVADFPNWPRLFSDVKWTKVKRRSPGEFLGKYESISLGHAHELQVVVRPGRRIRFEIIAAHGVDLWGEFAFAPDGSGGTQVRYVLHSDVTGVLGWFASEASVRRTRRAKVRRDLEDLARRFARAQ